MLIDVPVYVEVSVQEILQGIIEITGTLRLGEQTLSFDYRTENAMSKTGPEETLLLPLDRLRDVTLKQQLPGPKIILHPRKLVTYEYVPGVQRNELVFRVKFKHRNQAHRLVAHLQETLAEQGGASAQPVPFQLPDANFGLTEIKGEVYLHEAFLEFRVRTGFPGATTHKQELIRIEPDALEAVYLETGVFLDKLTIRPKTRDLFRVMPGMYDGKQELKLKIWRRYRPEAIQLVEAVNELRRPSTNAT